MIEKCPITEYRNHKSPYEGLINALWLEQGICSQNLDTKLIKGATVDIDI